MAKFAFILPSFLLLMVASLLLSLGTVHSLPLTRSPRTVLEVSASPHPQLDSSGPREETNSDLTPITQTETDGSSVSTTKSRPTDSTLPDATSMATDSTPPAPISVANHQLFTNLTRDIITRSYEASQAANNLVRYLVVHMGVDTTPPVPVCSCFIAERDPEDYLHGHISPSTDFVQRIIEDYSSTEGYISYTEWITENGSFPTAEKSLQYTDTFSTLQRLLQELRDGLGQLVEMVGGVRPTEKEGGDDEGSGMEPETTVYTDCCHDTSFPRQYQTFLELGSLFTLRYVPPDIQHLRDEVKE